MFGSPLRLAWELLRLSTKAVAGFVQAVMYLIEQGPIRRGARAARSGVLGPDDPPPPPELSAAALDYRGLARPGELALANWTYRLGRLREPGRKWKLISGEIGLPPEEIVQNAAVIGPAGSGRTDSIAVPWIYAALGSGRSVLAMDVDGGLWPALRNYGEAHGRLNARVYHWNYQAPDVSSSWRWLDELDSASGIEVAAEAILGRAGESEYARHRRDMRLLVALLTLARALPQATAAELLEVVADRNRLEVFLSRFQRNGSVSDLSELLSLADDQYADTVSGVIDGLRPLASPEMRRVTDHPGFTLELLDREPSLLIVRSPAAGGRTAEIALSLILALTAQRRLRGSAGHRVPMLMVLDDAPRVQHRISLPTLLAQGSSAELGVLLLAQSTNQFSADERDEILSNCATMILLPGVGPATTAYFTERLGQRPALGLSRSLQRRRFWEPPERGLSAANETVPMLGHREISMPPFEGRPAILHNTAMHPQPVLVDLTREDL
jgi:type IV secretory pathway TraG/TraD family ATPase VirD4